MAGYGPPDPLSRETIRAMVDVVRPEWTVRVVEPCERGSDVLYFLTVGTDEGGRKLVLKYCRFADAGAFLTEPRVLSVVSRETGMPVPAIEAVVDDHDELPSPYFLMERRPGHPPTPRPVDADRLVALACDAGRFLGAVHRVAEFEGFGPLEPADCDGAEGGTGRSQTRSEGADPATGLAVADPTDSWADRFHEVATAPLDRLADTRFEDLVPTIRRSLSTARDRIAEAEFTPVLCHGDYRPGNLLVDSKETTAVLGWRTAVAAPAEYDLARTEEQLCSRRGPGDDVRRRVRTALYEAYEHTNRLATGPGFEARRDAYLLSARVETMRWLPYRMSGADAARVAAAAAAHRSFVEALR
jgi:aminoglycoside phosphotransferase (APT) family kinase protein